MKTIEEAALEYAIQRQVDAEELKYIGRYQQSFKAGVEFAQQFIKYSEKQRPNIGENVIVRRNTCLGYHFICAEIFYTESKTPLWKSNGDFYLVEDTHWRPIELK